MRLLIPLLAGFALLASLSVAAITAGAEWQWAGSVSSGALGVSLGMALLAFYSAKKSVDESRWEGKKSRLIAKIERLERSRERAFRHITRRKDLGIVLLDLDGVVLYASDTAAGMLGHAAEEMLKLHYDAILDASALARAGVCFEDATYTRGQAVELVGLHSSGSEVPLEIAIEPADEELGGGFMLFATDLTKSKAEKQMLKDAAAAAEQANRTKSAFLANMSHEIRTPMTAIIGMSQLCLRTELTANQSDYVGKIHDAGKSLLAILNDVLDLSKIEAGELKVETGPCEIDAVLEEMAPIVTSLVRNKPLELIFVRDVDVPNMVMTDHARLKQILINLCSNAVKFTNEGQVVVRARLSEHREYDKVKLCFDVTDTGIGMTAEEVSNIFVPFTQADESTSRKFGGTGLGLSICRQLARLLGGEISVSSVPGAGSRFTFELVCEAARTDTISTLSDRLPGSSRSAVNILVIDDNDLVRQTLTGYIEQFGFTATSSASVEAALSEARTRYDLVLLDVSLRGVIVSAEELTSLRASSGSPSTKIVAMLQNHLPMTESLGDVDNVINKPTTPSMLLDAIFDAVGETLITERSSGETPKTQVADDLAGMRILLVEDNKINQQVAFELLESAGLTLDLAENGREALERLHTTEYDCVLMDIQMPEMDGYEATRVIRQERNLKDLPIVAMTADAMVEDRDHAIAAGMNDHVAKPIDMDDLLTKLRGVVKKSQAA